MIRLDEEGDFVEEKEGEDDCQDPDPAKKNRRHGQNPQTHQDPIPRREVNRRGSDRPLH